MSAKPKIIDLFCGCGGFGLGAEMAGFETIAAIDIDETLQSAYKNNFPKTKVIQADLSKLESEDWKNIINGEDVDGVIGGPPCQGYSRMGVGDLDDPRRLLLVDFFRHVNLINPKFFVMENVEGLLDKKNIHQLEQAISVVDKKYTVLEPIIVDASKYGVPTKRKRVVVVGFDKKRVSPLSCKDFLSRAKKVTVADAISDIPEPIPQSKISNDFGYSDYRELNSLSAYAKRMRKAPPRKLGTKEARINTKDGKVSGLFDTTHSEAVAKRYKETKPGTTDSISRSKKLAWDGFCPTLRAGTGSDKGSHQAVRPLHPESARVITVREAARLQGFPDWFTFHPTKWHSFRMIGNSVSPMVFKSLLSKIRTKIIN
jgi:DNA (cytosine-5)-methyltransferase 1